MSVYSQYAERLSERHGALRRIDLTPVSWEEAYVPLAARRGPDHAQRALDRFHETLAGERKRVREEQIKQLLSAQPTWDLLWRVPLGRLQSIRELVEHESRVVLLGEAGAGKTTALRHLVIDRPEGRLPATADEEADGRLLMILIDLPDVPNLGQTSLPEYLAEDAEQRLSVSATPEFFEQVLVRGQAIIGLDGLDEIASLSERAAAIKQIESWVSEFPNCRYIVAARPNVYEPALSRDAFTHYVLTPWNEGVVEDLERAWNQELDGWVAEEPDRPYSVERSRFWRHLVWVMRSRNRRSISMEEAEEWLMEAVRADKKLGLGRRKVPGEVQALLHQSVSELSFVQVDEGQLSFVVPLLYDVLAARAVEALCVDSGVEVAWAEIESRLGAIAWRETFELSLRFLAESHPDLCERLVIRLLTPDKDIGADGDDLWESLLHRRLLLAASALRTASDGLGQDVRQRVIDRLIAWMTDAEAAGREDAVNALLRLDGETYATERASEIAQDETHDLWSREAALLLLGRIGGMHVSEALIRQRVELLAGRMEDDREDARVRLAAATALGALGSSGALTESQGRSVSAQGSLVERLIGCIRNPDAGIDLRVAVGEALSVIQSVAPDASILETLVALARAENGDERPPYSVQSAAAGALERILSGGATPEFTEQVWALVRDVEINDSVRTALAEALGHLGDAEAAAQVLIEIAQDPKVYPPGHKAALQALGQVGYADQAILDQVLQIARTKDRKVKDFVRLEAARALSGLGHLDLAMQHMLMLIADKSIYRSTRNDALVYLGRLGSTGEADLDAAAIAVLQVWLNEENTTEDVRENAIESLCALRAGQDEIIRDMVAIVQNKATYPRVRRVTAAALGRLPIAQKDMVVDALSPVFYDPEEKSDLLRVPIARLLFLWGEDEHALAYLRLAAEQSYMAQVRYNASMVLLEIGELALGAAELLRLAQNPDVSDVIRCDAARALGLWMMDNEDVAPALAGIVRDSELEPNVRDAAYASLGAITAH
jgi:tetratricopeptide (TPR) repeat protein